MRNVYISDCLLLLVAFMWGATFVVVQQAVAIMAPFAFNGVRFAVAALFLFVWIVCFYPHLLAELNRTLLFNGMMLGFWLFAGYALQTFGLLYTTSSKSAFLTGLSVALVPIFTWLLFKQKIQWPAAFGIALATVGLFFMTSFGTGALNLGDVLSFFCAIGFAVHIILTGRYTSRHSALLLTLMQIATVAVLNCLFAVGFGSGSLAELPVQLVDPKVWGAIVFTAVGATAVAYLAQTSLQKYTPPSHVALIFTMEPVFAALTAYIGTGEPLTGRTMIGGLLIFLGMILVETRVKRLPWLKRSANRSIHS
ncbi:MAG TPA: DMT family transporter [Bacillales bacterium]|nr:DMT family transporter [Bacillales bacterium]